MTACTTAKQLRLTGPHAGASLRIGSLTFDRGVTRSMSAFDAEVHAVILGCLGTDEEATEAGRSAYTVEIIDASLPQQEGDHVA